MSTQAGFDREKAQAFTQKAVGDLAGTMATLMCAIGDRLGLFKALEANGPATSHELAALAGINERYATEWLNAMACAGYLDYRPESDRQANPGSGRFSLPPEHAGLLAQEGSRIFLGGMYQLVSAMLPRLEEVIQAFQQGGGVSQADYGALFWEGLERYSISGFENLLLQEWLPAVPEIQSNLERGIEAADIGCGAGRGLIKLAQTFPSSKFVGYDVYGPSIDTALANAAEAGVGDRVRFQRLDGSQGLPSSYDLITTFDVVHDSARPLELLSAIRQALRPGGAYLVLEINSAERLEDNIGPLGAVKLGLSVMYCMTTSLAQEGAGLGTMGLPESKLLELCTQTGFSGVTKAWEDPFKALYHVSP